MSVELVFVSAEASGDELAVDVIKEINIRAPETRISAIGGTALERVGLTSPFDLSPLSIVSIVEGLKIYAKVVKLADAVTDFIISQSPKAVILVDSWGFSIRLAQRLRMRAPEIKIIKLVGPQVWATRAGRAQKLAEVVDHLLCIHDFEVPFYEPYGLETTVIGNPALSRMVKGDGNRFRGRHSIDLSAELVLVLPGSRSSELRRVAPVLAGVCQNLKRERGEHLEICVLVSPSIREKFHQAGLDWPTGTRFIEDASEKSDLMSASTLALACSGTVTTELATQNCPMIVGYKLGWISWFLAKFFMFKAKYFTLLNVAADKAVVPELLQMGFSVPVTTELTTEYLENSEIRETQQREMQYALKIMGWGNPPAHRIAAEKILELIN